MNNRAKFELKFWAITMASIAAIVALLVLCSSPAKAEPAQPWHPGLSMSIDNDDDLRLVSEVADTLTTLMYLVNMPDLHFGTEIFAQNPRAFARARGYRIDISDAWASDYDALSASLLDNQNAGWMSSIGSCTPIELLVAHEFAHIVNNYMGRVPGDNLVRDALYITPDQLSYMRSQLSGYSFNEDGTLNASEALADAWAAYVCNGANELETKIAQLLLA
jgi:hypothetical protein